MKKYKDIYPNRIATLLNFSWDRDLLKKHLGNRISNMDIFRWASNEYYPPVDILIDIAVYTNNSTSYLLGQTNVKAGVEIPDGKPRNIAEIMKAKNIAIKDIVTRAEMKSKTAEKLIEDFPAIRTNSFIALSEALRVSTDYLLGLTDKETWDDLTTLSDVPAGYPAFIDDGTPSSCYVLISDDGKLAYFASGEALALTDIFFSNKKVVPISVDVDQKR